MANHADYSLEFYHPLLQLHGFLSDNSAFCYDSSGLLPETSNEAFALLRKFYEVDEGGEYATSAVGFGEVEISRAEVGYFRCIGKTLAASYSTRILEHL